MQTDPSIVYVSTATTDNASTTNHLNLANTNLGSGSDQITTERFDKRVLLLVLRRLTVL